MQGLTSANVQSGGTIIDTAGLNITIGQALLTSGTTTETLTRNGSGTLTLSNANTYSGDTTVNAGTLAYGADNVIPSGTGKGNVAVNSGATLDLASHNATINGLNNGGGGGGTVDSTVVGTPTLTVGGNDASSSFSGVIQNTAGTLSLTKIGAGTVTLSGADTYGGGTTISNGTLQLGDGTAYNGSVSGASSTTPPWPSPIGPSRATTASSAARPLVKSASGTLTLGAPTATAATQRSASARWPTAPKRDPQRHRQGHVAVNSGATLDLAGHNTTINGLNDGAGGGGKVDNTGPARSR